MTNNDDRANKKADDAANDSEEAQNASADFMNDEETQEIKIEPSEVIEGEEASGDSVAEGSGWRAEMEFEDIFGDATRDEIAEEESVDWWGDTPFTPMDELMMMRPSPYTWVWLMSATRVSRWNRRVIPPGNPGNLRRGQIGIKFGGYSNHPAARCTAD